MIVPMKLSTALVAADGTLQLTEEQTCALGVPNGGEIEIVTREACVELRRKRAFDADILLSELFGSASQASDAATDTLSSRQAEDFKRRTTGC